MKYSRVCFIINIFAISVIFASADDPSDSNVKEVHSKAVITIKDSKNPSEVLDNSPLSADISFTDNEGNNIAEAEDGRSIKFDIIVKTDTKYKYGKVIKCEIYEKDNPSNKKILCDECSRDESIDVWIWDQENQKFTTNFKVMKLPGSESNKVVIECTAVVCKESCPSDKCSKPDSRQKRRALFKKFPWVIYFRSRTNG